MSTIRRKCSVPVLLVWLMCGPAGGCDETADAPPAPTLLRPHEECEISEPVCQEKIRATVAAILEDQVPQVPIRSITVEELKQEMREGLWALNELEDEFTAEAKFRIGLYRQRHASDRLTYIEEWARRVAAYYDSARKEIVTVERTGDNGDTQDRMLILAHELTHAYQDELLDLGSQWQLNGGTWDTWQATTTIKEGHAELVRIRLLMWLIDRAPADADWETYHADLKQDALNRMVPESSEFEPFLTHRTLLHYWLGLDLMVLWYWRADLELPALVPLLIDPPSNTAALLAPLFCGGRLPPIPDAPDPAHAVRPAPPPLPTEEALAAQGLSYFDTWQLGAWDLALLLLPEADDPQEALNGMCNWQDGWLDIYLDRDWEPVFLLRTRWLQADEAEEFARQLRRTFGESSPEVGLTHWKSSDPRGSQDRIRLEQDQQTVRLAQATDPALVEWLLQQ